LPTRSVTSRNKSKKQGAAVMVGKRLTAFTDTCTNILQYNIKNDTLRSTVSNRKISKLVCDPLPTWSKT